jgi:hypothetical protein
MEVVIIDAKLVKDAITLILDGKGYNYSPKEILTFIRELEAVEVYNFEDITIKNAEKVDDGQAD